MLSAIILAQVITIAAPMAPTEDVTVAQDPYAAYKKNLIPIGTKVPNFNVKDDKGQDFDLYKTFNDGMSATRVAFWQDFDLYKPFDDKTKGTIVNFWFAH